MDDNSKPHKIFISYSWSNPAHEDWVLELAIRLVNDGVDVILDKWNLREGHDKFAFMESMVQAPDIEKVLIISDSRYATKANERSGGVGTETSIITPKIYASAVQEKFLPIVAERDHEGNPYLPHYLDGRIYFDMSAPEHFEAEYDKLLRRILNRPSISKPTLGKTPRHLLEDSPINFKTRTFLKALNEPAELSSQRINAIVQEFFEEFLTNLETFIIELKPTSYLEVGEIAMDKLSQYTQLRDDFINLLNKLTIYGNFNTDLVLNFFERLPSLTEPDESVVGHHDSQYGHMKFIVYELFMYAISVALKNRHYKILMDIFNSRFFVQKGYYFEKLGEDFTQFNYSVNVFDEYYNKIHQRNLYSPQADLLLKRLPNNINKNEILDADLLCCYVAKIRKGSWFPRTYIYRKEYNDRFTFLSKLASMKHFEQVKGIFGVSNKEELRALLEKLENNEDNYFRGYPSSFRSIPLVKDYLNPEQISIFS